VRLLTNNPAKTTGLEAYGIGVAERVPLTPHPNDHNLAYLQTKRDRMGHHFPDLEPTLPLPEPVLDPETVTSQTQELL
jgi:3,4-dihydroxy 2-butanone 4-phosphate synthase/GTP cyclohydrolase II